MSANVSKPVDVWTLNASGLCSVAANWSLGAPLSGGAVVVAPTASGVTLTFDVAGFTLSRLTFENATTVLEGGSLNVTTSTLLQAATFLGPHALILGGASQVAGLTLGGGMTFYNRGALTQLGSPVVIGASKTSRALAINLAGATWTDSQDGGLTQGAGAGGAFSNRGAYVDSAGGVDLIGVVFASVGTVSVAPSGTLQFAGNHTNLCGNVAGGGLVDYAAATTLGPLTVTATNQTNFGVVNVVGDLYLQGAQTITDRGAWNIAGDVSMLVGVGESALVSVVGYANATFNKTAGNGVSLVGASVNLSGRVNVASGTLDFTGATSDFEGPLTGAGTFEIGSGAALLQPYTNTAPISVGLFRLSGGTTTIQGAVTDTGGFEGDSGATLTFGGEGCAFTITGLATLSGLNINGSGSLFLDSHISGVGPETMNVSGVTIGGGAQVVDEGQVLQGGDVTLGDALATDAASLTVGNGSAAAEWVINKSNILSGADPASTLTIGSNGSLVAYSAGVNFVAPALVNNGLDIPDGSGGFGPRGVQVDAGTLDLKGAVSGTGSLNILSNLNTLPATLELDSSVGAGQNVAFAGVGGTLFLTDLADFHATITGFGTLNSYDSLVFGGGLVALGGATETSASATLTLLDSNHGAHTLTLTGDYIGHSFSGNYSGGFLRVQ